MSTIADLFHRSHLILVCLSAAQLSGTEEACATGPTTTFELPRPLPALGEASTLWVEALSSGELTSSRYGLEYESRSSQSLNLRRTGRLEEVGFHWRPVILASSLALTGALVAHWSTNQADEEYDRYLEVANVRRQNDAFESAERYDRLAGAAFVAMEVGILLTVYYVLF